MNWETSTTTGLNCPNLTYLPEEKYTWNMENTTSGFSFVTKAYAQNSFSDLTTGTENLLSVPLYILIIFFMLFTVTMSGIYMYHWVKFNLNDPFITNFSIIYFLGLCALLVPLIFNLIN
jgi:preprotein translocase subunit SecG